MLESLRLSSQQHCAGSDIDFESVSALENGSAYENGRGLEGSSLFELSVS